MQHSRGFFFFPPPDALLIIDNYSLIQKPNYQFLAKSTPMDNAEEFTTTVESMRMDHVWEASNQTQTSNVSLSCTYFDRHYDLTSLVLT